MFEELMQLQILFTWPVSSHTFGVTLSNSAIKTIEQITTYCEIYL